MREINYTKAAFTHFYNYCVIAIVLFMMLAFGGFWGWLYLLAAVEAGVLLFSNTDIGQRYLAATSHKETEGELLEAENEVYRQLDSDHKYHLDNVRVLCAKITKRSRSSHLLERLTEFRYKFAQLLQEHYYLESNTFSRATVKELEDGIARDKKALASCSSPSLRSSLQTNINLQSARLSKINQTGTRRQELEMHLEIVKNSLELIYQDAISATNDDVLSMVDSLVANVELEAKDVSEYSIEDLKLPAKQERDLLYVKRSR